MERLVQPARNAGAVPALVLSLDEYAVLAHVVAMAGRR